MKKIKAKIIIVPHYSGSVKRSDVFKRVITEQIEKKMSKIDTKTNNAAN